MIRRHPAPDNGPEIPAPWDPILPALVLMLVLFAFPAWAGIDDIPDPFGTRAPQTHTVTDDATPFVVHGRIVNQACSTASITVIEIEGAIPRDYGMLDDLARCRVNEIHYSYRPSSVDEMLWLESTLDAALDRYFLRDACDTLAECSAKIEETCKLNGKQPPKFSMLKPYSKTGYKTQMCSGTCGDNVTVVNVTCRIVKPTVPPGQVAR